MSRRANLPHAKLAGTFGEVCRPLLPPAERLLPYLQSIDRRRWYTNWGELAKTLESRLSARFGLVEYGCIATSNATDGITAALVAVAGRASRERPCVLMPSYTFVATAAAALNAGYAPHFVDVDPETFAMNPSALETHPALPRAGAVVAVAPYGRPIDGAAWRQFSQRSGIPVVIDAAAAFDTFASGIAAVVDEVPTVLSFHATKVFGVGEGGAILCAGADLSKRCRRALNFGFFRSREAQTTGINGKMSEYHAAVGLAELDDWTAKRAGFLRAADAYSAAAERYGIGERIVVERTWASSYAFYLANGADDAIGAGERLHAAGFGFRWWYGNGVHREPGYADFPADPLPVTADIAPRLLGLPVWADIDDAAVDAIVATVAHRDG